MISQNDMHEANETLRAACRTFAASRGYGLRNIDTDEPTIIGPRFAWTLWLEDSAPGPHSGVNLKGVSRPASEGRIGHAAAKALLLDRTRAIVWSGGTAAMYTGFYTGLMSLRFGE
jgi:hypothetical protein